MELKTNAFRARFAPEANNFVSLVNLATGDDYIKAAPRGPLVELYALADGTEWTDPFMMTTYADWQNPTVREIKVTDSTLTIGVRFKCNVKSWGTVDDVTLNRISD